MCRVTDEGVCRSPGATRPAGGDATPRSRRVGPHRGRPCSQERSTRRDSRLQRYGRRRRGWGNLARRLQGGACGRCSVRRHVLGESVARRVRVVHSGLSEESLFALARAGSTRRSAPTIRPMVHAHARTQDRRALTGALVLIVVFMAGEVAAALIASSLALLADAGHMLTDAAALGLAIVAASMAARPARGRWTFGFKRVEVLAAQINGLTLLVIGIWIVYGAVRRLIDPPDVEGGIVLVVALVGIAVNLAATSLLARASKTSINVRGAFVHVLNDLAAFIGTAVAGGLILATGWNRFDPIASLAVAALIAWSSWGLLRESTRIFLRARRRASTPTRSPVRSSAERTSSRPTTFTSGR